MLQKNFSYSLILLVIILPILFTGCRQDPVSPGNDVHATPVGFVLEIDGDELYRVARRVHYPDPDDRFPEFFDEEGILTLSEEVFDENNQTPCIKVRWLDSDEEVFDLPPAYTDGERTGGEHELRFRIDGGPIDEIPEDTPVSYEIDREETGWSFRLTAHDAGEFQLSVVIWHIDHEDVTMNVKIRSDI
jgi:hypothetical protein